MRVFLRRFPILGGLLFFALLGAAALAGPQYFRRNTATHTVITTNDNGPGSLRQALADAQDGDTIQFDLALNGQTISLSSGELVIDKSITISGPGATLLTVSRSGASQFRIFHALSGHAVVVEGLTIAGGDVHNNQSGCGGGILNDGATSTINNCTISGNRGFDGGGICSNDGSLTIANSSVASNQAGSGSSGGSGGGIYHRGGSLELIKSTLTNNTGINYGGGVMSAGGTIAIIDSTIRSNTTLLGGGIEIGGFFGGTGDVRNSTISGNTAQVGGGIATSSGAALTISNCTVSGNSANIHGGGISNDGAVEVGNTILNSGANVYNNGGTVTSHGYNLCSDDGAGLLTGPGDQINTGPLLGPLQDNGGPTFTHALLPGSPAINAGDPNFTPPPDFDQRGPGFHRVFDVRIDIGSLEVQPTPGPLAVSLPITTFDTSVPIDTVIIKPVLTTNIDANLNYVAFQGDFIYDERVVTFSEPFVEKAGLTAGKNWSLLGNPLPGPGPIRTFRVSALSLDLFAPPLSGSGTLYNLRMLRVSSTPGNTCPLVWKPDPDNFYFVDIDLNIRVPDQNNGLITITGKGTPTPSPPPTATPTATATATATPTATATSGGTPTPGPPAVSLPISTFDTSVPIDTVIIQPVLTTNIDSSLGYVGFQADFTFDERVVTFSAPFVENAGLTAGNNWNVVGHPLPGPGPIRTFRFSVFSRDFTPLSGAGTLFNLRMLRVSSTPGNTSPLVWRPDPDHFIFIDGLITITGTETPTPSPAPSATPTATATATPTATATLGATPTPGPLAVSLPISTFDTSVPIDTVIIQPVLTTNIDASLNYVGFQGDFTYDSTVVSFSSPFVQIAGLTAGGNWHISIGLLPGPGPIKIARLSAFSDDFIPLNGSGTLFNLRMVRVSGTPGATSPLVWRPDPNNFVFIDGDLNAHVPDQNNGLITITGKGTPTPSPAPSATPTATATATPTATAAPSATPTPGSLAVSLPIVTFDASVPISTVIIQPVLTTNIDASLRYIGFQGDFTYDSTVVTFPSPFVQAAGLTGVGNWNVSANILPGPGPIRTFRLSAFSLDFTPLSGSGTLFNLRMLRVGGTPGTTSPLVWQPDPNNFVFIDSDLNTHVPIQNNGLIIITGPGTPTPSPPPSPTPTATPCGNTVFSENFDGVVAPALPPGWVTANAAGAAPMWVTSTTTPDTVPNDAFIDDPATVSDKLLDTPNIAISSAAAQVSFRNFYFLESTFDGGVLEVSSPNINAGAFTDITAAAVGGSFVTGAYSATISTAFMSPIAGRMAWTGNAGGYINTVANLGPNVAGQTIKLRFRMASDNSVSATGWRVDTIRVAGGTCASPTPTASPSGTPPPTPTPPAKVSLPIDTFDTSVPIATVIIEPVLTTNIDASLNYVGFQGDFTFDQRVVTFSAPFVANAGLTAGTNWNVVGHALPGPGPIRTFRLSAFSLDFTPLSGSGTLFNLRMLRVSSTPGNTSPLVWGPDPDNFIFIDGDLNSIVPDQNNGLITITGAGTPTPSATATCPPVITQSTSQAITTPAPLCIHPPFPSFNEDNHYWRAFNMQHFVGGAEYTVSSVSFGVFSGSATVIVRLYTNNGAPFPTGFPGSLTQIGTTTLSVTSGQGGTVVTTPLVATAPVGTNELVMELYVPELAGFLFPGANTAPETGPSYWSSVNSGGCGSTPGVISSHLVFNVYGACGGATSTPTPNPTPPIAPPTHFAVSAPAFAGQNFPFSFTVTAQDQFNNTVPDYAGTVHFTSTDSTAELPMDSTLLGGTGTFQATLHMAAEQTITATDTSNASLTGTSNIIFVEPFEPPTPTIPSTATPTPTPVTPTPTPTLTPSPTPTPCTGTIVWSENFDELPPGPIGSGWVISTTDPDTPPNDAFCPDLPGVSGAVLDFSGVPIPSASTVLRFRNNFNLEFSGGVYWAGGVLEVSSPNISGGAFLDITDSHVGGSFVSGGYTGIIEGAAGNPLAGRLAWGGNSGGYIDSVINLGPNLVGQTVTLRFLFGSDGSGGAPGWRVDTMTITDGVCTTPTPTPTPGSATHFAVVAPSEVSQNLYFDFTVTALDQFNNTVTNYPGTVHFTSTSAGANQLPPNSMLTNGAGTFSARLFHTGNQTITATDLSNPSITGTSNPILVIYKGPPPPSPTPSPSPTASATPSPIPARPINLSTRMLVQTGDSVGIGGFIITHPTDSGTNGKQVLLRAIGPSLSSMGIPNFLADPVMELHGPAGFTTIVNDNWRDTQEAEILATGIPPSNNLESAIVVTLDPGNYTAIVKGRNNTSGVGLVEVYDLDPETSQLANISTRAFVGAGGDVVIGGFILGGGDNTHIDIFGLGPSLAGSGVSGVLADPTLELRNGNGTLLGSNDNCDVISIHPLDPVEACIEVSLPPGAYTAILAGKNGGTGIGLVEIYNLN